MRLRLRPRRSTQRHGGDEPPASPSPRTGSELQRRREGLIILCTAVAVLLFAFFETRLPQFSSGNSLTNNVIFFLLINLNIILLVLLVFLVARNLAKLVFERRRRMLGSHLRTRLVLAFLAVSIFPAVLIFLVALGFMTSSIENWFNVQVENSLAGSLEIARSYYQHGSETALHHARALADRVARERLVDPENAQQLGDFVATKQREYDLGTVEVYGVDRQRRAFALADDVPAQVTLGRTSSLLSAALDGRAETRIQSMGDADVIRAAVPVALEGGGVVGAVVVDYFVPQSVANRSAEIARSFQEYRQLKILKQPIISNYVVTLVLVTLLVIFCATWMGFYLAKGITVPIQKLAEGTREVAQGNWQYRIGFGEGTSIASDDEFGTLVGSFNQMTADLETINLELEKRRRYMETILGTMTGGVISLDQEGRVTTINEAAERLLGLDRRSALGRDVAEVFARPDLNTARELMQELRNGSQRSNGARAHRQLKLVAGGRVLTIVLTATVLRDDAGQPIGAVLFFEDVTEIVKVQRMEAWREVARRIAHEIKNPLTPIQLSAQRLHKRYAGRLKEDGALFEECTRTIVTQVEELKTLVNEFATFARLPSGEHTPENLNTVIEEATLLFKEGHRDIRFSFDADASLPLLPLDREGIKRAVINMLDNAVAALSPPNGVERRIEVSTRYHRAHGIVALEIADTGCGIDPNARARLFEPYFSTKQGGTGLGLAIVSTIVADHQGFVRVKDNEPRGSRFIIELPVKGQVEQFVLH